MRNPKSSLRKADIVLSGSQSSMTDRTQPPPKRLDRVRGAIRARHYSVRTEEAYVAWIKRFIFFHGKRHPAEMGKQDSPFRASEAEVNQFLTHLAVKENVSASTQNQASSALLFLYKQVLGIDVGFIDGVVRARRPKRWPAVLTRNDGYSNFGSWVG